MRWGIVDPSLPVWENVVPGLARSVASLSAAACSWGFWVRGLQGGCACARCWLIRSRSAGSGSADAMAGAPTSAPVSARTTAPTPTVLRASRRVNRLVIFIYGYSLSGWVIGVAGRHARGGDSHTVRQRLAPAHRVI